MAETDIPAIAHPRVWRRPEVSALGLNLAVATYIVAVLNPGFWSTLRALFPGSAANVAILGAAVWCLTLLLLALVSLPGIHRPLAALMVLIAASAGYFHQSMGVIIDREMVRNVLETTVTESRHLLTADAAAQIFLTGVVPALLLFVPRLKRPRLLHVLWRWPLGIVAGIALTLGCLSLDYKANASVLREHHELLRLYQPGATINAVLRYSREEMETAAIMARPLGRDAIKGPLLQAAERPVLLVVFAGETVRAQNFGLAGYARDTTPGLRRRDVIYSDAASCGTSTAVSVPCMFSPLNARDYSRQGFLASENLLDVLAHAGMDVQWWDNNTGDQQIAARTGWQRVDATLDPAACATGECTDAVFLPLLERELAAIERDTVLVLHMIGSHGPAYYLRYPPEAAVFGPDCRTAQFSDCTSEEIVNAYDNSILETDRVLSAAIDMLQSDTRVLPVLIYLSDHGESLGEHGLYLHAAPKFMAPDVQTRVPFMMWLPQRFSEAMKIDMTCLSRSAGRPVSQDNLFHTVLGLADIRTGVRKPALDLTAGCRTTAGS